MPIDLATMTTTLAGLALTWLVQSSVLLALGLLAGRLIRKLGPAVQSAVYRTTLAAVLVCPLASGILAWGGLDGLSFMLPPPRFAEPAGMERGVVFRYPPAAETPTTEAVKSRLESTSPIVGATPALDAPPRPIATATPVMIEVRRPAGSRLSTLVPITGLALAVWIIGALVLAARLAVGQRRMAQLRASAIPAEPDAEALCRDLAGRLHLAPPSVMRSPFLFSPCLDGLRRPAILLPDDDDDDNLHETLVHELAHLARRDGLWNLLRRSASSILWIQPLLWILSRRLEATAEEVCDDYVVQHGADRARYAGHLVELAGRALPPTALSGVGMISLRSLLARRVVRILDPSRRLSTRAGRQAVAASLLAGLAGTLLAGLLGVGWARKEAKADTPPKAAEAKPDAEKKAEDSRTVRGQVIDPDGKPVPGATVIAARPPAVSHGIGETRWFKDIDYEYVRTVADANGRFEATFNSPRTGEPARPDGPAERRAIRAIATAPGFGMGYYREGRPIRLARDRVPVNGRLVDLEGRPAAGVKIYLTRVLIPPPADLREADGERQASDIPWPRGLRPSAGEIEERAIETDAFGRFRIEGLGRDMVAVLEVSGPTVAFKTIWVVAKPIAPQAVKSRPKGYRDLRDLGPHGDNFTITVEPTRPIEGVVRDLDTGEPIPGAVVTGFQLSGSLTSIDGQIRAKADSQGRYRLVGLSKEDGKGHKLAVYPPLDRPYFVTQFLQVPASPGLEPIHYDIPLRRGTWIEGKVTDLKTGKPVQAAVDYFPLLSNPHAKGYPNFDPNVTSIEMKARDRTDREGRFRIVGLPGRGVLTAVSDDKGYRTGVGAEAIERTKEGLLRTYNQILPTLYQSLKEVSPLEGSKAFSCDLTFDPGGSVTVKLVDEAGNPVPGATFEGRYPEFVERNGDHNLHEETTVRVAGIDPGETRTVVFQHKARKLGAVLDVTPEMAKAGGEVILTLRPNATITGRFLGEIGSPPPGGVQVRILRPRPGRSEPHEIRIADAQVEANGRFRCDELPAGARYLIRGSGRLVFGLPDAMNRPFKDFEIARDLSVAPGQTVDLGTFDVKTGKRADSPAF